MSNYLKSIIDYKKTRRAVQEHLKFLSRGVFNSEIQDFTTISSPIGSEGHFPPAPGANVIRAMNKKDLHNQQLNAYKDWILKGLNMLKDEYRDVIIGKYILQYDQDEFEEEMNLSPYGLKRLLREAEIDLAIILDCVVNKKVNHDDN